MFCIGSSSSSSIQAEQCSERIVQNTLFRICLYQGWLHWGSFHTGLQTLRNAPGHIVQNI